MGTEKCGARGQGKEGTKGHKNAGKSIDRDGDNWGKGRELEVGNEEIEAWGL